jgi:hypothetical protein
MALFSQNTHEQLTSRWEFTTVAKYLCASIPGYKWVESGGKLNMVNRVMKLTRGKLFKQND